MPAQDYIPEQSNDHSQAYAVDRSSYYPTSTNGNIQNLGPCAISPQLSGIMEISQCFTIRRHKNIQNMKEDMGLCDGIALCCACDCCTSSNARLEQTYSIYAGSSLTGTQAEILRVDEVYIIYVYTKISLHYVNPSDTYFSKMH